MPLKWGFIFLHAYYAQLDTDFVFDFMAHDVQFTMLTLSKLNPGFMSVIL